MIRRAIIAFSIIGTSATPVFAQEESNDTTTTDAQAKLEENQQALTTKQTELAELDRRIEQLSQKQQSAADQAQLAADKRARLSNELAAAELSLEQTILSITTTQTDLTKTTERINDLNKRIDTTRASIGATMRSLYERDNVSLIDVVLGSQSLSGLLAERRAFEELQQQALNLIRHLRQQQDTLAERIDELKQQQNQLQQLKENQGYQQVDLAQRRQEQAALQQRKEAEQARFEHQLTEAKQAREEIEQHVFRLRGVGLELDLTDATTAARYASNLTGVKPSLLLGIIKVETNVGAWIGSGSYPDDMHPQSRDAFLRITKKLNIDPATTPISRRPTNIQGWGGAMGPGQVMPATWEGIESRVASVMNKPIPNPYELADALVAVGIMLADRGATDPQKEIEAVGRYIAGPNWRYHMWYVNRVLAVAREYEKEGV